MRKAAVTGWIRLFGCNGASKANSLTLISIAPCGTAWRRAPVSRRGSCRLSAYADFIVLELFSRNELRLAPNTRQCLADCALSAENVAVQISNPLATALSYAQVADSSLDMAGNTVPIKLRI